MPKPQTMKLPTAARKVGVLLVAARAQLRVSRAELAVAADRRHAGETG